MSSTQQESSDSKKQMRKKTSKADQNQIEPVECEPVKKRPKQPKLKEEAVCEQTKTYRSPAEQRLHLEQEVVPIVMQGMLELAREQPRDPISYLEKFWLQKQHKCDINIPDDLL